MAFSTRRLALGAAAVRGETARGIGEKSVGLRPRGAPERAPIASREPQTAPGRGETRSEERCRWVERRTLPTRTCDARCRKGSLGRDGGPIRTSHLCISAHRRGKRQTHEKPRRAARCRHIYGLFLFRPIPSHHKQLSRASRVASYCVLPKASLRAPREPKKHTVPMSASSLLPGTRRAVESVEVQPAP